LFASRSLALRNGPPSLTPIRRRESLDHHLKPNLANNPADPEAVDGRRYTPLSCPMCARQSKLGETACVFFAPLPPRNSNSTYATPFSAAGFAIA